MTLTPSIPVLRISDDPRAKAFRAEALGFTVGEEGGDPARFGIFHRDAVCGMREPEVAKPCGQRLCFGQDIP